ncbi:hypothetical protein JJD26997_0358 [Campylobacter jejuni subsp. doylei 269.97]|uniref:CopG family transcriptional regulator n=2 Tax=Campylobacter jejuni subsp. doylei TaxID=32021 RepID=A7H238_CAMJD|nr:hypothetical protein JJD26997_0358 [Campylobacter jejuni subsp. doylei 269.97]AVL46829.1 hypothetical protein CEP74_02970 [Campylobacter jejuni subsp. doylei]
MNLEFSKETQHFLTNYCKDNNLSEKEALELALSYLEHKIRIDGYKKDVELYKQGKLKTYTSDEVFAKIRAKINN